MAVRQSNPILVKELPAAPAAPGAGSALIYPRAGAWYVRNGTGDETGVSLNGHAHAAADITSGVLATARLGTGTANSTTYLRGDGTWATVTSGGASALDDLTDVTVTSPATGNVIRWSGTEWVNAVLAIADVSGLQTALDGKAASSHTHTTSQITSLFDTTAPAALGTAAAGSSTVAARRDHVHAMPTAAQVGAAPTSHTHTKSQITDFAHTHAIADLPVATSGTSSSTQVVRADDTRLTDARTPTAHTLESHSNVDSAAPAEGDGFIFESGGWKHRKLTFTDVGAIGSVADVQGQPAIGDVVVRQLNQSGFPEWTHQAANAHTHHVNNLTATGTKSTSTYLRGDNTWATPPNTTYAIPSQAEAEAGTATTARAFTAQRVKQAVDALWGHPGDVKMTFAPTEWPGWYLLNGQAISRSANPTLFGWFGTSYGAGDGSTTFNLPNVAGLVPMSPGNGAAALRGSAGGSTVTIYESNLPPHTHPMDHNHGDTGSGGIHDHELTYSSATGSAYANVPRGTATEVGRAKNAVIGSPSHTHSVGASSRPYTGDGAATLTQNPLTLPKAPHFSINFMVKGG